MNNKTNENIVLSNESEVEFYEKFKEDTEREVEEMGKKIKRKYKLKPLYVLDKDFTQIANTMFRYIPNGNDFKVYCYLCFRYNREYQYAFPSLTTISNDTCLSLSTVKKSVKWLTDNKFIRRYKKHEGQKGWLNNCYYVRYVVEDTERIQKEIIQAFEDNDELEFETELEITEYIDENGNEEIEERIEKLNN